MPGVKAEVSYPKPAVSNTQEDQKQDKGSHSNLPTKDTHEVLIQDERKKSLKESQKIKNDTNNGPTRKENDLILNPGMRADYESYRKTFIPARKTLAQAPNQALEFQEQINRELGMASKQIGSKEDFSFLDFLFASLEAVLPQQEIDVIRRSISNEDKLHQKQGLEVALPEILSRAKEVLAKKRGDDIPLELHVGQAIRDKAQKDNKKDLEQTKVEERNKEIDALISKIRIAGFEIIPESLSRLPIVTLTQEMSLEEVTLKLFVLSKSYSIPFRPRDVHYALLLQSNPDLEEYFKAAEAVGYSGVKIPAGTPIAIQATEVGINLEEEVKKEMLLHLDVVLGNDQTEVLSSKASELALHIKAELQSGLKALELRCQVARYVELLAYAEIASEEIVKRIIRDKIVSEYSYEQDIGPYFERVDEIGKKLEEEPKIKEILEELKLARLKAEIRVRLGLGLELLQVGEGIHARKEFNAVLTGTQALLKDTLVDTPEFKTLHELRAKVHEHNARTYLYEPKLKNILDKVRDKAPDYKDPQVDALVAKSVAGVLESYRLAREELSQIEREDPLLEARAFEMVADLYGNLNDTQSRHHWLCSAASRLFKSSLFKPGDFYREAQKVAVDESTGALVPHWWDTDSYMALSDKEVNAFNEATKSLGSEEKEKLIQLIFLMSSTALEFEDPDEGLRRALCHRQLASVLDKVEGINEESKSMLLLLDVMVRFRYGEVNGSEEAVKATLNLIKPEIEKISSALSRIDNKIEQQHSFDENIHLEEERRKKEFMLERLQIQTLSMHIYLAQSQSSLEHAKEVTCTRQKQEVYDTRRTVVLETHLASLYKEMQAQVNSSLGVAQESLMTKIRILEAEIKTRHDTGARLMFQEALTYLHAGYPEKSRELLEECKSKHAKDSPWVVAKVGQVLKEKDKGKFVATLQATLRELNSESMLETAGWSLAGAGAGALIGSPGGPPGVAVGVVIGLGASVLGLKGRNLIRGAGRISEAYNSGMSNLSFSQSMMDTAFLAVDVLSIGATTKAFKLIQVGVAKETIGKASLELVEEAAARGVTLDPMLARKEVAREMYRRTAIEASSFGGKWSLYLVGGSLAIPVGVEVGSITLDNDLSVGEKQARFSRLYSQAAGAGVLLALSWGSLYGLNRLTLKPSNLQKELRRELEKSVGNEGVNKISKQDNFIQEIQTPIPVKENTVEVFKAPQEYSLAKKLRELSQRIREEASQATKKLLEAQHSELRELLEELKVGKAEEVSALEKVETVQPINITETATETKTPYRVVQTKEVEAAIKLGEETREGILDLRAQYELNGDFETSRKIQLLEERLCEDVSEIEALGSTRKGLPPDDAVEIDTEIGLKLLSIDEEVSLLKKYTERGESLPRQEPGDDYPFLPWARNEKLPFPEYPRSGGGSFQKQIETLTPTRLIESGRRLMDRLDTWSKSRKELIKPRPVSNRHAEPKALVEVKPKVDAQEVGVPTKEEVTVKFPLPQEETVIKIITTSPNPSTETKLATKTKPQVELKVEPQQKIAVRTKVLSKTKNTDDTLISFPSTKEEEKKKRLEGENKRAKEVPTSNQNEQPKDGSELQRSHSRRYRKVRKQPPVGAERYQNKLEKLGAEKYDYEIEEREY